jgi:glycosyltransferase involved in cell wall biosynthesis
MEKHQVVTSTQNYFPLVTIITPSLNQVQYLESTIRSVLEQDYPSLEYIIVDGGSTDGSIAVIRRFESHLAYWVSEPDRGQSDAINKGLACARGQYIAWLNSDDIYLPNAVSKAVDVLEKSPQAGLVYANCSKIDDKGNRLVWRRYRQYTLIDLLSMYTIAQPTVFMRRDILESVGGLESTYNYLMDHHLWIRMAHIAPIIFVDDYWAGAREHLHAKNIAQRLKFAPEARRIVDEMARQPDIAQLIQQNHSYIEAGLKVFEAGYLLADGQSGQAMQCYLSAITINPHRGIRAWRLILLNLTKIFRLVWIERLLYRLRARLYYKP